MSRYIDRAELFNRLSAVKTLAEAYAVVQDMPDAETKNVPDTNVGDMISRQAAIKAIYETFCYAYCDNCEKEMNEDLCGDCHRKYQNWAASKKIISKTINSLPSAERNGRWEQDDQNKWRCSICKAGNNYAYAFDDETKDYTKLQDKYCPSCGARMDEVEE